MGPLLLSVLLGASPLGPRLAEQASRAVGLDSVHELAPAQADDCSGFVRAIYGQLGIELTAFPDQPGENGVTNIRRRALAARALRRKAAPGDLVFFHDTTRVRRHRLTHIGIVESVEPDGTVTFVHRAGAGIVRSRMDLRHPRTFVDAAGRRRNDILRRGRPPGLTGQLFAGFAAPEPLRSHPAARAPRRRQRR